VRNLCLPQWRKLAEDPAYRCLIPLTEFCEWTPDKHDLGDGGPIKGEMWLNVKDQPIFAIAGFWRQLGEDRTFAMVTCNPNELVAPIHPKAMITILAPEDHERWLTCPGDEVLALPRPYSADRMTAWGPVFPTGGALGLLPILPQHRLTPDPKRDGLQTFTRHANFTVHILAAVFAERLCSSGVNGVDLRVSGLSQQPLRERSLTCYMTATRSTNGCLPVASTGRMPVALLLSGDRRRIRVVTSRQVHCCGTGFRTDVRGSIPFEREWTLLSSKIRVSQQ
jgi:hypothetical protein